MPLEPAKYISTVLIMHGIDFYRHLGNISEFLTWFCGGVLLAYLAQVFPNFAIIYVLAFVLSLAYFSSCFATEKEESILRIVAILASVVGLHEFIMIYPELAAFALILFVAVVLVGGYLIWRSSR